MNTDQIKELAIKYAESKTKNETYKQYLIDAYIESHNVTKSILESVTRFEVINHGNNKLEKGRLLSIYNSKIELSLQDENRTLKVFLSDSK